MLLAAAQAAPLSRFAHSAENAEVIADTACGKIRGTATGDIKAFEGIPYGANTEGKNRFMPPVKPAAWTGVRDALGWGPTTPQNAGTGNGRNGNRPAEGEDCLIDLLLAELGLRKDQARELQSLPLDRLLAANAAVLKKTDQTAPGYTANTPMVDGKAIPADP